MMTYYCKLLCIVLFVILLGGGKSQAQSKEVVVYRDYTRQEAGLVVSLYGVGVMSLFIGIMEL